MPDTLSLYTNWFCWTQRPHHFADYLGAAGVKTDIYSMRSARARGPAVKPPHRMIASCYVPRPFTRLAAVRRWNAARRQRLLDRFFASDAPCLIYAACPAGEPRDVRGGVRIYDCMDDWTGFPDHDPAVARYEEQLCRWADRIWVVSRKLCAKLGARHGAKVEYVPNGVHYEHFEPAARLRVSRPAGPPRLGYVGAIESWMDTALVREVARLLRGWEVVMVGPNRLPPERQAHLNGENIQHAGWIPYDRLPSIMATFDVAMIPFQLTSLIEATSPIKLFEYLAAGLPVVATSMPEVVPFEERGVAACRDSAREFAEAVRQLHEERRPDRCQEIGREHSWRARFAQPLARAMGRRELSCAF